MKKTTRPEEERGIKENFAAGITAEFGLFFRSAERTMWAEDPFGEKYGQSAEEAVQ